MSGHWNMVTVSGPPGSGTTTVCGHLQRILGWKHVNAGEVFRQLAVEAGVDVVEFGHRAERDGSIDRKLDSRMVDLARLHGQVILEGRLSGWMALRHGLPALRCWLEAPVRLRAERVGRRDGQSVDEAAAAMAEREASEMRRYREVHGIDCADLSIYHLVVNTAEQDAAQIAGRIAARVREGRDGADE